ncbi:hypothetical protein E4T54_04920 [Legionella geestiana]|nr:hypothetical protein E4T54_04920 [Legionella geestiana]
MNSINKILKNPYANQKIFNLNQSDNKEQRMCVVDFSTRSFKQRVYLHALIHQINISTDIIAALLEVPLELIVDVYAGNSLLNDVSSLKLLKLIAIYSDPSRVD